MRLRLILLLSLSISASEATAQGWVVTFYTQDYKSSQRYRADKVTRKPGNILEFEGLRTATHIQATRPNWQVIPQTLTPDDVNWDSLELGPESGMLDYQTTGPPQLISNIPLYQTSFGDVYPDEERHISRAFVSVGPQSPAHVRFQTFAWKNVFLSSSIENDPPHSKSEPTKTIPHSVEVGSTEQMWIVTLYTAAGEEAQSFEAIDVWEENGVLAVEVEDPIENTWTVKVLRQDTAEPFSVFVAEEKPSIEHGTLHFFSRHEGGGLFEFFITQPFILEGPIIYIGTPAMAKKIIPEASTNLEWNRMQ